MVTALRVGIARWLPAPPSGALPLALPRRRIYIVPSRFGLIYGGALFLLMLGSLNYNNNPAILLAILLAIIALLSAVSAVRFLSGLNISDFDADECFAGETQPCRLHVRGTRGPVRGDLHLRHFDTNIEPAFIDDVTVGFIWRWPSERRGRRPLGRVRLSTNYPLGLFHAWCVLEPHADAVVYPAPESPPMPLPTTSAATGDRHLPRHGEEDWHALREFQRGDSLRDIAWKISARHDRWLVAEKRANAASSSSRFSLDQVAHLDREHGIARLARWILVAEAAQTPYALTLPNRDAVAVGMGPAHRRHALTALAELP